MLLIKSSKTYEHMFFIESESLPQIDFQGKRIWKLAN